MRAFRRLCLAPIILAAATTFGTGASHQAALVAQSPNSLTAHACPAGSNWDNTVKHCV